MMLHHDDESLLTFLSVSDLSFGSVSNALIDNLSYMSEGKVVERDVIGALEAQFGQDVSHRTREMDTYTDILAEVNGKAKFYYGFPL
jgi:hypothetical protein